MMPTALRSKLFVPGTRPEFFAKAIAGDADALSFDLEDAVAPGRKAEARAQVAACVAGDAARGCGKVLIVRCNDPAGPEFAADVVALVGAGIGLLNLPKIDDPDALCAAVATLAAAEAAHGAPPVRLLVNIETPRALLAARGIAMADPRVAGLQLGLGDLFSPHGVARGDVANVHAAMFAMRMAAAAAGVFALDGAWPGIDDPDGFEAEAAMARRLGFAGKSCIHPRQVALANAAFAPDAGELAAARRIVAAADAAAGTGALVVDGRMVDGPYVARARAVVAAAR